MANIIRIRKLDTESNLKNVVIPVDKDTYSSNCKYVTILDLKAFILSGYTGDELYTSKYPVAPYWTAGGIIAGDFRFPSGFNNVSVRDILDLILYPVTTTTTTLTTTTTSSSTTTTSSSTTTTSSSTTTTTTTTTTDPYYYYTANRYTCVPPVCGVLIGTLNIKSNTPSMSGWGYYFGDAIEVTGSASPGAYPIVNCEFVSCDEVCAS